MKSVFTQRMRKSGVALPSRDRTGFSLWQRRYWKHTIRDEADYARHVDYIHSNLVKHRHVGRAVDWPHSSLHRFIRQGMLPENWGGTDDDGGGGFGERGDR